MKRKIVILTKSSRHKHYCVVGYDIDNCKLVRLVSSDVESQGSVKEEHFICSNGQNASILDIAEMDIIGNVPTDIHIEDLLFNEKKQWKYLGKFELANLPQCLFCTDDFLYADASNEISFNIAKQMKKSIIIAKVQNLLVYRYFSKTKASFEYNDNKYLHFSVTDPDFYNIEQTKYENAILIITLPNDNWSFDNNRFFKFIAKIYPQD